jgi:hypothetical protein
MKRSLPPRERRILGRTIRRRHEDILELLIRDDQSSAALEHVRRNDLRPGGYRRLSRFYNGLSLERAGRRGRAAAQFLGALLSGWGRTRVRGGDILLALFRTALPVPYRLARAAFRRLARADETGAGAGERDLAVGVDTGGDRRNLP